VAEFEEEEEMFRFSEVEADALLATRAQARHKGRPRKIERAENLLQDWLQESELKRKDIEDLAVRHGIGWRTIEQAKQNIGVKANKRDGKQYWYLP
jgi:hypothetical protein